jgi:pimeloyl-ACP methyl ester carboxylesterase
VQRSDAVDGFRLAYDDHSPEQAAAVVLLHGWPGDRHDFRDVVPLLAGRCRVLVPDLRGFGESVGDEDTTDATPYGADGQARSVLGLVESLGVGPVVLAAYDVGSRISRTAAAARPDLVRGLVLSPPMPGAGDRVLTPSTVAMALQEKPPAAADRIAAVTTVLWPEHDPLFPRDWSDRVPDWFADPEVRPLDGVGHFTPLEAPEAFAAAVLERVGAS